MLSIDYVLVAALSLYVSFRIARTTLFFLIRLWFLGIYLRNAVGDQMLHGPSIVTRCLIYSSATFERWRLFQANGYQTNGVLFPLDALDATTPIPPMQAQRRTGWVEGKPERQSPSLDDIVRRERSEDQEACE